MLRIKVWSEKRKTPAEGARDAALDDVKAWDLLDLTPAYIEDQHGGYALALTNALSNHRLRNIALSGNYGVGKSSVLAHVAELAKERGVVELSLSALAPMAAGKLDEAIPAQATTPTNRIQQEIVKQLLYRVPPRKSPASRFRRIERSSWPRELSFSALFGLAATVGFLVTDWASSISSTLAPLWSPELWIYPILFVTLTTGIFCITRQLSGRLRIRQLSAASAAVTLDDNSVSYFDQYLDEIVYFFEMSEKEIVIFEDIDRFDDPHIFETLRSLNTLLNESPQIEQPIQFVYAIKDSIFDQLGLAARDPRVRRADSHVPDKEDQTAAGDVMKQARAGSVVDPAKSELARANRTKFFDLVIPVVPFITHRSARSLHTQTFEGLTHQIAPELMDLAGRHVPDMRLLKNARNEFIVFRDRVFSGGGGQLQLNETKLFAMMLFKSTHLTDFEQIRLGTSTLDLLYNASRELVSTNLERLESEIRDAQRRITQYREPAQRAELLGTKLLEYIDSIRRVASLNEGSETIRVGRIVKSRAELLAPSFWAEFSELPEEATISWNNNYGESLTLTREDLQLPLGPQASSGAWRTVDTEGLEDEIAAKREELDTLRGADMDVLMQHSEWTVGDDSESLEQVGERLLTRGLAFELVRAGHIDKNFTLYTSTFHGDRVGPAATRFIIHHIEKNAMDAQFPLAPDDVDAIVRERGVTSMRDAAYFNINILDRVLSTNEQAASAIITGLTRMDENAARFLQTYLTNGVERELFAERLAGRYPGVLPLLIGDIELEPSQRIPLVSRALRGLGGRPAPTVDEEVGSFLREHQDALSVLREEMRQTTAFRIARVFEQTQVRVTRLAPLSTQVRDQLVARDLYTVDRENLLSATESDEVPALDVLRNKSERIYKYALRNLDSYLKAIGEDSFTNDEASEFVRTVEDVMEIAPDRLDEIVARASPKSRVGDLAKVAHGAWKALARAQRFDATFGNIKTYLADAAVVDEELAEVLIADKEIRTGEQREQLERVRLAKIVLNSGRVLSADLRAQLVESLGLNEYLDVAEIPLEDSGLFSSLLRRNIIADDAETFSRIETLGWETRRQLILVSARAPELLTPAFVGADLAALLRDQDIVNEAKIAVVERAHEFAAVATRAGLQGLAQFAIARAIQLPIDVVVSLASARVDAELLLVLLRPHLRTIDRVSLAKILTDLGGAYAKLAGAGLERPTFNSSPSLIALLDELKRRRIVSSFDRDSDPIRVSKRHR